MNFDALSPDKDRSRRVIDRFVSSLLQRPGRKIGLPASAEHRWSDFAPRSLADARDQQQQEDIMKRTLALALAAGMVIALASTSADAQRGGRGGGGMGGGGFGGMGGGGGLGGGGLGGGMGGGNWAGGMGGMGGGNWAGGGGHWHGGGWRPGWGWGAAGIGAAAYPWGYGYGYDPYAYASGDDSCLQQRRVRRGGVYRRVWVRVC
jgi:hypothetical protein